MNCNSRNQALLVTQCKASILSYTLNQSWKWIAKKTPIATLVVLLGLGGGFWLTTEANAPKVAQAETTSIDLSIVRQPDETYETLLDRAEAAARTAVQDNFEQDMNLTDVSIMVVAQNQGSIAPVLSLEVSRTQWFSNPDVNRWVTYFTTARSLLGFEDVATTTAEQPGTSTSDMEESDAGSSDTQGINNTSPEAEIDTPVNTLEPTDSTLTQPGTVTPVTPSQTPASSTDLNPQPPAAPIDPPANIQSPSLPNTSSPTPSGSTLATPQTPSVGVPNSGTTNNSLTPTTPNITVPEATQLDTPQQ